MIKDPGAGLPSGRNGGTQHQREQASLRKDACGEDMILRKVGSFPDRERSHGGIDLKEAKKQQIHRYELQTKRLDRAQPEKLIISFAESLPRRWIRTQATCPRKAGGSSNPDAAFARRNLEPPQRDNGFVIIEELIPGGSAERSGLLRPKDKNCRCGPGGRKASQRHRHGPA